jgi:hypothetical protein
MFTSGWPMVGRRMNRRIEGLSMAQQTGEQAGSFGEEALAYALELVDGQFSDLKDTVLNFNERRPQVSADDLEKFPLMIIEAGRKFAHDTMESIKSQITDFKAGFASRPDDWLFKAERAHKSYTWGAYFLDAELKRRKENERANERINDLRVSERINGLRAARALIAEHSKELAPSGGPYIHGQRAALRHLDDLIAQRIKDNP